MPYTKIFLGVSYTATSYGSINIEGKGDTAQITLRDNNKNEKQVELKVYQLSDLKKTAIFKKALSVNKNENLIHPWSTKKTSNQIIKYSGNDELAFVFTSDIDVDNDFVKLFAGNFSIDYFKEAQFIAYLQGTFHISIEKLREIPGMDEKKILLIANNIHDLSQLMAKGISIQQIGLIDFEKLEKHLQQYSYQLEEALNFVTIQQILGLEHKPIPVANIKISNEKEWKPLGGWGRGSSDNFSYEHTNNEVKVTHKSTTFKVAFGELKKEASQPFDNATTLLSPEKLVHDWYLLNNNQKDNHKSKLIYSPEAKYIIQEVSDAEFPEQALKTEAHHILVEIQYYHEKAFIEFLAKKGHPIEQLRELPGITEPKLQAFCKYKSAMTELIEKGVTINDFAKAEEDRLILILENYNNAKSALEFVNAQELLGLNNQLNFGWSPGLFSSANNASRAAKSSNAPTGNNQRSICQIL